MSSRRNINRFYRGARRHPKWDMGAVPNPRGRSPFRAARRKRGRGLSVILLASIVIFGPNVLDAASLMWRKSEGCAVWSVVDGDTVRMVCPDLGAVSGRILSYDTPELKARCPSELGKAVAATFYLRWQLWTAGEVTARPTGTDRYDRALTVLAVDGELVGRSLVEAGLARWYNGGKRRSWCGA